MKKSGLGRILCSIALCIVLTATYSISSFGANSTEAKADASKTEKKSNKTYSSIWKFSKAAEKKYVEGEALVVLRKGAASGKPGALRSAPDFKDGLGSDVAVEATLTFDSPADDAGTQNAKKNVLRATSGSGAAGFNVLKVTSKLLSTESLIKELKKNKDVLIAEPNYIVKASALTNDTYSDFQWGLNSQAGIDVASAWNGAGGIQGTGGNAKDDAVVAIIDTGIDYTHEELKDSMWVNPYPQSKLRGKHGYNFAYYSDDPMDDNGHGTHVAGIIGARGDNNKGVSGVNKKIKFMALKFLPAEGPGNVFGALSAYEYIYKAQRLGTKIIAVNNSWGGPGESAIFDEVITRVGEGGCVTVSAAGNEYSDIDQVPSIPASSKSQYSVAVAASDMKGKPALFTNYGSKTVALAAPGTDILSSVSYNNYNPTLYPGENTAINNRYFDGSSLGDIWVTSYQDGEWKSDAGTISLQPTTADAFGGSGSSLLLTIPDAEPETSYNVVIPYTSVEDSNPVYASIMAKVEKGAAFFIENELTIRSTILAVSDTRLSSPGVLPDQYKDFSRMATGVIDYVEEYMPSGIYDHISGVAQKKSKSGDRAIVITYIPINGGEQKIYLDDIGVSKPIADENVLGKYDFYSGTSMAAPFVTGSIAQLSALHPSFNSLRLAQSASALVGSVSADWKGKTATESTLKLTRIGANRPFIESIKINGLQIDVKGSEFGSSAGTVKVNGASVTPESWSNSLIKLPLGKLENSLAKVEVTARGLTANGEAYLVNGKIKPIKEARLSVPSYWGGGFVASSDAKYMYYINDEGEIMQCSPGSEPSKMEWTDLGEFSPERAKSVFPDSTPGERSQGYFSIDTEPVYVLGKLYFIASLESSFGDTASYALVSFNPETKKWKREGDVPGAELKAPYDRAFEFVSWSTLASYNGKIYLMGGYDSKTKTSIKDVRVFDPMTQKWTKGPSLPEGRFASIARQSGTNLVLALGGDAAPGTAVPTTKTLVFNGTSWKVGAKLPVPLSYSSFWEQADENDPDATLDSDPIWGTGLYYRKIVYARAAVGAVSGGIVISGLPTDGYGDTFTYKVSDGKYRALDYQISEEVSDYMEDVSGTALGNKMYVAYPDLSVHDFLGDSYNASYNVIDDFDDLEDSASLYSFPITYTKYKVSGKATPDSYGSITGVGSYTPGSFINLTAKGNPGYYPVKGKFVINGNKATGQTYPLVVQKNGSASAVFKKYATKVRTSKTKEYLNIHLSTKLKASVSGTPKDMLGYNTATHSGVTWKSSNSKYATVSASGLVSPLAAGIGKAVTITAEAKDGSGATANVKVYIYSAKTKSIKLKAASRLAPGKSLTVKATPSPAAGTLNVFKWTVSNAKYAAITQSGKLTAKAAGRGKTVTVTCYALDGSGKKATVKVRIG